MGTDQETFLHEALGLLREVEAGKLAPDVEGDRETVLEELRRMIHEVRHDAIPPVNERKPILGFMVVDHWPWHDSLGKRLSKLEREYMKF